MTVSPSAYRACRVGTRGDDNRALNGPMTSSRNSWRLVNVRDTAVFPTTVHVPSSANRSNTPPVPAAQASKARATRSLLSCSVRVSVMSVSSAGRAGHRRMLASWGCAMGYRIAVGTVGSGLWVSYDAGGKFRHIPRGPDVEGNCRALAVSPHQAGQLLAAVDKVGVFRSDDNGGEWHRIGTTIPTDIWSLAFDPSDADRIFVGTRPGVYRSTDGGE